MMNKKEILKKVGGILTELNEQFEYLSKSPENLNELELELFSANANFLSDHLSILVKLNDGEGKKESTNAVEHVDSTSRNEPEEAEELESGEDEKEIASDWKFELVKEPAISFEFEEKQTEKLFDRPLTDEEKEVIEEKTKIDSAAPEEEEDNEVIKEEIEEEIEEVGVDESKESNNDIFIKEVVIAERTIAVPAEAKHEEAAPQTLNDMLSMKKSQETVGSQFNLRQTKDLKGMISLNDKLLFVRDLFNGYSLAYSEALELLNRFDSFEAADNFLKQNYSSKNHWAEKQDVADKFYEVLNRRFSK